jgi:acyl-coenzyme A synthetase/AMP-(fatty) acid ligase
MPNVSIPERYNASVLLDGNLEAGRGNKVAVRWGDRQVTYQELFDVMCRSGLALGELGIGAGDRVLLVLDDRPEFPAIFLGAIRAGAVPVPVNPLYDPEDYPYFVKDSGAKVLIADPARADKMRAAQEGSEASVEIVTVGGAVDGLPSFDEIAAAQSAELPPANTHRDDMAFWLYSSGSTGSPKGVVHLQHDILYTCETYAKHALKIVEDDVTFSSTKLFHAYGLGNNLSFPYWAGASTVLLSGRPTPDALFDTIRKFRPTLFFSVPTLFNAMLNSPPAEAANMTSVRACISAAEPLPAEVWHRRSVL